MTYLKEIKDIISGENELFSHNNPCIDTSMSLISKKFDEFVKKARDKKTMREVIPIYKEYTESSNNIFANGKNICEAA